MLIYQDLVVMNINRRHHKEAVADIEAMERQARTDDERALAASMRAVIEARADTAPNGIRRLRKTIAKHDSSYTAIARTELQRLERIVAGWGLDDDVDW
jgi:hypothetical protein